MRIAFFDTTGGDQVRNALSIGTPRS